MSESALSTSVVCGGRDDGVKWVPPSHNSTRVSSYPICFLLRSKMSDKRSTWSLREKELLQEVKSQNPTAVNATLTTLFNQMNYQKRTVNAVRNQLKESRKESRKMERHNGTRIATPPPSQSSLQLQITISAWYEHSHHTLSAAKHNPRPLVTSSINT
jgi:hypothetical protein